MSENEIARLKGCHINHATCHECPCKLNFDEMRADNARLQSQLAEEKLLWKKAVAACEQLNRERVEAREKALEEAAAVVEEITYQDEHTKCRIYEAIRALKQQPCPMCGGSGKIPRREQPCGCILCVCEDDEQCQGCGAKLCINHFDKPLDSIMCDDCPDCRREGE